MKDKKLEGVRISSENIDLIANQIICQYNDSALERSKISSQIEDLSSSLGQIESEMKKEVSIVEERFREKIKEINHKIFELRNILSKNNEEIAFAKHVLNSKRKFKIGQRVLVKETCERGCCVFSKYAMDIKKIEYVKSAYVSKEILTGNIVDITIGSRDIKLNELISVESGDDNEITIVEK